MIEVRRLQRSFADGLIAEEVDELWEPWMRHADEVLNDESLLKIVQSELAKRYTKSKTRGRRATPAEVVLRMMLLKHIRNWSYEGLAREVRANLVYREFTRVGGGKVPDDKTMGRLGRQLGPEVIRQIHERMVGIAKEKNIVPGRKLRVDTTVVETNIHYPTDSSLLGDGAGALTRVMKKIALLAGEVGAKLRDRSRSIKYRILEIGRAARNKSDKGKDKLETAYKKLLETTGRVVGQAKTFSREIASGVKSAKKKMAETGLQKAKQDLDTMIPRVQKVMQQARERIFNGNTRVEGKLVSIFEPDTEVIRKGKAAKPTEFGKMVKIQEAENQIVTSYEVFDKRPSDSDLLIPSIQEHERQLGRTPVLVAADAGFFSAANEAAAEKMGVDRVSIPNRSTKKQTRKKLQKSRWFKKGQKWRTGCEGRISVLKRRHGLQRSRYKGSAGVKRWVGLGVIADNLINIGRNLATQTR